MPDLLSRLEKAGLSLPQAPRPVASYVPAVSVHSGHLVFVSGQIPMRDGTLIASGLVPDPVSMDDARLCARQCVLNALACLGQEVGDFARLRRVVRLDGFVACGPGFTDHPQVINGASDLLIELLGDDGRHSRAAVGVASLPLGAPVEIAMTFLID